MEHYPQSECGNRNDVHVLVVPYPLQGHIGPLSKLSDCLVRHGIKATLVVTEHLHGRITEKMEDGDQRQPQVNVIAVSDGLKSVDDRNDERRLAASVFSVFPGHVKNLIERGNKLGGSHRITCLIADAMFGWALETAEITGIEAALFWTCSPGALAVTLQIPELVEAGIIDDEGIPRRGEKIQPLPAMPSIDTWEFPWCTDNNDGSQKIMFKYFSAVQQVAKASKWLLCNFFHELDTSACKAIPNLVPVGPLSATGKLSGTVKQEDSTCLKWLDLQKTRSVIYIAFGSLSVLSQKELNEVAFGLQLTEVKFLWVVRSGMTGGSTVYYPDGFLGGVGGRGKIVEWAPQEKVLAHPSIACFMTHCGWNSTMEAISMGVPFLCWPCFADQLYTKTCICDSWKIGLNLVPDEDRIISRHEIKRKVEELVSRVDILESSRKLKEAAKSAVVKGGSSYAAIERFIEQIRG